MTKRPLRSDTRFVVGVYSMNLAILECTTSEAATRFRNELSVGFGARWVACVADTEIPVAIYSREEWLHGYQPHAMPAVISHHDGRPDNFMMGDV